MPVHFHAILEIVGVFLLVARDNRGQVGWIPINGKLWQRHYWERIIRNEQAYRAISDYIINNLVKWKGDTFYIL